MDRGASAGYLTELAKSAKQMCHLVQVIFDDEAFYLTDAYKNITYDGDEYIAEGHLLEFSDIDELTELQVSEVTLSLSGVDQQFVSAFLSHRYIDRTVKIYKALLDSSDALISDPILIFDGRMDKPRIRDNPDDGKSIVAVSATNHWVDFERKGGRRTNHEEQQLHFPGDMGFEFASEIITDIKWGRA